MTLRSTEISGPNGQWLLVVDDNKVAYIGFPGEGAQDVNKILRLPVGVTIDDHDVPSELVTAVTAMVVDDVALSPDNFVENGTPFQQRVWQALRQIPRGQTRTYSELAAAIGQPTAVRAVAHAVATNPVPVAVPCHRVLPKSGGVGQYRGGSKLKAFLLSREGVNPVK
ncbi:methylated-DNA--[protein]-cysteine S-methyltransferase [uncultured Lacticaseibacillus sp.]|uniref:methylated-DNA--[protein]-cysteine S-methyltransferase n=1 Tax=uncultured Lacticaseibacillus sp. TaxID=2775882 RepID=UPI002598B278|nr:methylated-DNA--[protein]-cysteine S-methyltransferase [uncultured Lacticaseibacillus sp.]